MLTVKCGYSLVDGRPRWKYINVGPVNTHGQKLEKIKNSSCKYLMKIEVHKISEVKCMISTTDVKCYY